MHYPTAVIKKTNFYIATYVQSIQCTVIIVAMLTCHKQHINYILQLHLIASVCLAMYQYMDGCCNLSPNHQVLSVLNQTLMNIYNFIQITHSVFNFNR